MTQTTSERKKERNRSAPTPLPGLALEELHILQSGVLVKIKYWHLVYSPLRLLHEAPTKHPFLYTYIQY